MQTPFRTARRSFSRNLSPFIPRFYATGGYKTVLIFEAPIDELKGIQIFGKYIELSRADKGNNKYVEFTEDVFTFEIPPFWEAMSDQDLLVFKQEFEKQSEELYKHYYRTPEDNEWGVPFICGFFAPEMEASIFALIMKIPPQEKNYLEKAYKRGQEVIDWGISQGKVKNALSNKITELNGIPCLETCLEWSNSSRMAWVGSF